MNLGFRSHWDNVYQTKGEDDLSWTQPTPSTSLSLIKSLAPERQSSIIDVGGGTSLLAACLLDEGYSSAAVLDISAVALAQAKIRLGSRAERIEWIEASVTEFYPSRTFDVWHDRAVFHFLTSPDDRRSYVGALTQAVPSGHAIISTFSMRGPEKCSGLEIVRYDEEKISREIGASFSLQKSFEETHVTPWGAEQQFAYFVFGRA
jgi:2-polyprenyl-3-methyl-5-hydroxy-6-metoxy-1,4-benzoquinol methylase